MTLAQVQRFRVPRDVVRATATELARAGRDGYELFALWSGQITDTTIEIATMHVPQQTSYKTDSGLLVRVEGDALHRLNVWLYENEQILAAQIHAHPTTAFHSPTDDAFPIVTELGGLSVVAPNFARNGILCKGAAVYRLEQTGWNEVPDDRVDRIITIVP